MRRELRNAVALMLALLAVSTLAPLAGAVFGFGAFLAGMLVYVALLVYIVLRENRISSRRTGVLLRDIRGEDTRKPSVLTNAIIVSALAVMIVVPRLIIYLFYGA